MHCLVWGGVPVARKGAGMAAGRGGSADGLRAAQQDEPAENLAGAPDGGTNPAGAPDGEMNPAGAPDGGTNPAGPPDGEMNPAGAPDGGTNPAGPPDGEMNPAGAPDGGTNPAGPPDGEIRQEISVARRIRAQCLASGRTPAETAAAIHDQCGPVFGTTWIRARRMALGIALADVVAQIRARYEAEGRTPPRFSETLLSAYESGQKRPGPEYLHYLCAVYRAEPADLGYPGQCFCGRSHRAGPRARPATQVPAQSGAAFGDTQDRAAAGSSEVSYLRARPSAGASPVSLQDEGFGFPADPREAEDDDDVLRRAQLRMIADAATGVDSQFLGAVERIRRRMDDALVGGTVSATMLDQWEETTADYGIQYLTVPPLRLLCDVLLDFGDVRRMCEHRQPLDFSERLCRLAAQLAGLAGMIMIDVGHQRLARSFFRTARTAGDETGDRQLRAWIAVREALVPLYYGDPAEAVALARAGAGLAGRNVCVAAAMAPVMEARALARVAARRGGTAKPQGLRRASGLLDSAHEALSRLPGTDR